MTQLQHEYFECKLYWKSEQETYGEQQSVAELVLADDNPQLVRLTINDINHLHNIPITNLRIDPINQPAVLTLLELRLLEPDNKIAWQWDGTKDLLANATDIFCLSRITSREGLTITTTSHDPYFELHLPPTIYRRLAAKWSIELRLHSHSRITSVTSSFNPQFQKLTNLLPKAEQDIQQQSALRNERTVCAEAMVTQLFAGLSWKGSKLVGFIIQILIKRRIKFLTARISRYVSLLFAKKDQKNVSLSPLLEPEYQSIKKSNLLDQKKEIVLVVVHQANRTGAPILAWNICRELKNQFTVIALLLTDGDITAFFKETCDILVGPYNAGNKIFNIAESIINYICQQYKIKFAIINSYESRFALQPLAKKFIPTIFLIHEFYSYMEKSEAVAALQTAGDIVFPAKIVQENIIDNIPNISPTHILPQGKSKIPSLSVTDDEDHQFWLKIKEQIFSNNSQKKPFIVLGAGTIVYRKGVDLFIATALAIKRLRPEADIMMVWIGDPEPNPHYPDLVTEQIHRYGLENCCKIIRAVTCLEEVYQIADLFFLSSRLDPLPNVAIDVMYRGIPLLCFEKTSGIAEVLEQTKETADCILPFANIAEVAKKILAFYQSFEYYSLVSEKIQKLAQENFDMKTYVASLIELGKNQARSLEHKPQLQKQDCEILRNSNDFVKDFFLSPYEADCSRDEAIFRYVESWYMGRQHRKPAPGFNPASYINHHNLDQQLSEPFAHSISFKKPTGPWQEEVFQPSETFKSSVDQQPLQCALHIHVYYPDLFKKILDHLQFNNFKYDLYISIPAEEYRPFIRNLLVNYAKGHSIIKTVPNRGRDIGPLLTEFGDELQKYDVIGHVHTKKTPWYPYAETWNNFLMQNLLGDPFCMADQIINKFWEDSKLGLVYPDDPNLIGWTKNKPFAEELKERLNIDSLPEHTFSFPIGTMFWARPIALRALFDLKLTWDMYPSEPLSNDGSILHALERLLPIVVEKHGFKRIVTYIPGISR